MVRGGATFLEHVAAYNRDDIAKLLIENNLHNTFPENELPLYLYAYRYNNIAMMNKLISKAEWTADSEKPFYQKFFIENNPNNLLNPMGVCNGLCLMNAIYHENLKIEPTNRLFVEKLLNLKENTNAIDRVFLYQERDTKTLPKELLGEKLALDTNNLIIDDIITKIDKILGKDQVAGFTFEGGIASHIISIRPIIKEGKFAGYQIFDPNTGESKLLNKEELKERLTNDIQKYNKVFNQICSKPTENKLGVAVSNLSAIAKHFDLTKEKDNPSNKAKKYNIPINNWDSLIKEGQLEHFMDLYQRVEAKETFISILNKNEVLLKLLYKGKIDLIKKLIKYGVDANIFNQKQPDWLGRSILHKCISDNVSKATIKYLLNNSKYGNKRINAPDKSEDTPLHYAYKQNNFKLAEYLIKKGADPTIKNNNNQIPIQLSNELNLPEEYQNLNFEEIKSIHKIYNMKKEILGKFDPNIDNTDLDNLIEEHKNIRKESNIHYMLGEKSKTYKFLMSADDKTIEQLINKMSNTKTQYNEDDIIYEAIDKEAPPELLIKMAKIAKKAEELEGQQNKPFNLKDAICKILNFIVNIFKSQKLIDIYEAITDMFKEFKEVSKTYTSSGKKEATSETFVERIQNASTSSLSK